MATGDESDDVRARPPVCVGAAVTLTEGDVVHHGRGKGIASVSSSGATGRGTTTDAGFEVVTKQGKVAHEYSTVVSLNI